jgi:hypothetical protein
MQLLAAILATSTAKVDLKAVAQLMGPGKVPLPVSRTSPHLTSLSFNVLPSFDVHISPQTLHPSRRSFTGLHPGNHLLTLFSPRLDCTKSALTHRIRDIKLKARDLGLADAVGTTPPAKTPTKRGRKVKAEPGDDDNNDANDESPTKKSKATPTKAKAKAKAKAPIKAEPIDETEKKVKSENESDEDSDN